MKTQIKIVIALLSLFFAAGVYAQSESIVNQGTPGKRGAWPVTGAGGVFPVTPLDGSIFTTTPADGSVWQTAEVSCSSASLDGGSVEGICLVTNTTDGGQLCPTAQAPNRRYVTYCNRTNNTPNSAVAAVSLNSVPSTAATTGRGTNIGVGDCVTFWEPVTTTPRLISNSAAGIGVTFYECVRPPSY
jgi:hypothetical protein